MKFAQFSGELNAAHIKEWLKSNLPLLGILLGFIVMSAATGQFSNYDSQLEYNAALGVIEWGLPYFEFGHFINQPPLGFYIGALFLKLFGASYATGVAVATLFGIGCTVLVYKIGKALYGKQTGLLATAIFASTPWHIVFSRSFLIDVQCLFFSLTYLLLGIYATKKHSTKLFLLSGVFFGVAFLTKAFAVFMLVPLGLFYFIYGPINLKRIFAWVSYFLPALGFVFLWYEVISNRGFFAAFTHDDFFFTITGVTPSPFFVVNYLIGALGVFFLASGAVSLLISFMRRKTPGNTLASDLICVATVAAVAVVNMYLAIGRNLICPYTNPVKYEYQLLPLFCILAASLINKCYRLCSSANWKSQQDKLIAGAVIFGLILVALSMVWNVLVLNSYATQDSIQFTVENKVGYSLEHVALNAATSIILALQWLGFAIVAVSVVWANKDTLKVLVAKFQQRKNNSALL